MSDEEGTEEERAAQVRGALLKALAVVAVIGVVIAIGTTIMVRALGLNEGDSPGPIGSAPAGPAKPLPTTALPDPGTGSQDAEPTDGPSGSPSESATPKPGTGEIVLDVSPIRARPNDRVNLTGTYEGADSLSLEVQRFQDGQWQNFGVTANVKVGTYATYIMTGRPGEQRFRMYDPETKEGSNVVLVTIN